MVRRRRGAKQGSSSAASDDYKSQLLDEDQFWESTVVDMPPNTTIEVTTVVVFLEPDTCSTGPVENSQAHVRRAQTLYLEKFLIVITLIVPKVTLLFYLLYLFAILKM